MMINIVQQPGRERSGKRRRRDRYDWIDALVIKHSAAIGGPDGTLCYIGATHWWQVPDPVWRLYPYQRCIIDRPPTMLEAARRSDELTALGYKYIAIPPRATVTEAQLDTAIGEAFKVEVPNERSVLLAAQAQPQVV